VSRISLVLVALVFTSFLGGTMYAEPPDAANTFYHITLDSPSDGDMDTVAQSQVLQLLGLQLQKDKIEKLTRRDWAPRGTGVEYCVELRTQKKETKNNFETLLKRIEAGTDSFHPHPAQVQQLKYLRWEIVKNCN